MKLDHGYYKAMVLKSTGESLAIDWC
jgi:hypothetical protein